MEHNTYIDVLIFIVVTTWNPIPFFFFLFFKFCQANKVGHNCMCGLPNSFSVRLYFFTPYKQSQNNNTEKGISNYVRNRLYRRAVVSNYNLSMNIFIFSGSAARRGLWPSRPRSFLITHNDAPHSAGLLWTSDQLVAETFTWQHTTHPTEKHPCFRWDSNPQLQQASGRRPTP
jgi:hypothetical protein